MAQVNVIHGYTASPEENWYPWIQQTADQQHYSLKVLRLDPSTHPELSVWESQIDEQIEGLDENSIVIAHSLGTIAALHYLSKHLTHQRIKQLVLVAGFNGRLGRLEEVYPFIDAAQIDFELLKRQIEHRVVIYSEGDQHVPPKFSIEQAQSLDAELISAQCQGHFIDSEGCTKLPEVWQAIQPYLIRQN
ncbi:RBBP9/YdeN family alpha/beta hydrolase [Acinetobacter terrae]|uniref:Serine hydrolase family protein n=1 Tax=Acinetobacter terrae TaxID=2731247 RepID=A0A4R0ENE8_9GAMM|nr:alpha/beta hydrolase [Acinetobacter terrae]TCB59974.1 serine hydrolase family protein [Acinetobacter terrae]